MTHAHLQPFFGEPLSEYKIFRAKKIAEGLVVTLARIAAPQTRCRWRTVVIPNGATYSDQVHVGCAVFNIHSYDERGNPGDGSRWRHKALCAPAQRRYRNFVRDVWQCFSRHQLCVGDAMATRTGIVALTYGDDPKHLTLRESTLTNGSVDHTRRDRIIGECSVQLVPHTDMKASDFQLGREMYTHVISDATSSPNDFMHLPTFKLDKSALEHCMYQGETSQLLELIAQSTAKRRDDTELAPGTTLIREYNGITYRVKVLGDARFDLDGRAFKSLSAVARAITGTSYSGPVFFGLKPTSRARKAATA